MHTLVLVEDVFVKLSAMAGKVDLWPVHLPLVNISGSIIGAEATISVPTTIMMLESGVKVCRPAQMI